MIQTLLTLSRRQYIALAALGSAVILASAFGFQHIGGLAPCQLCFWQRWPHAAAMAIGAIALAMPVALVLLAGALAMLVNAGIALYHSGVERHWWEGPASCTSRGVDLGSMSMTDLLDTSAGAGIVLCDEIPWAMFGLSMANYNVLAGLGLAAVWLWALRRPA